jgi:hypothetical protein
VHHTQLVTQLVLQQQIETTMLRLRWVALAPLLLLLLLFITTQFQLLAPLCNTFPPYRHHQVLPAAAPAGPVLLLLLLLLSTLCSPLALHITYK